MSTYHLQASVALALVIGIASTAAAPALAQGLPQHMVAYMAGAGQKECPEGWTEAAYAQGRLILGATDGSDVQKMAGTPAQPNEMPQHDHTFTITGTVPSEERRLEPDTNLNEGRAVGGQVTSTGTTVAAIPTEPTGGPLPFIQFLVCENTVTESPDSAPYNTVAFFNAKACPANWTHFATADERFILPAYPGSVLKSATSAGLAGHTHGLSAVSQTQTAEYLHKSGPHAEFAKPGGYTLAGTSAMATVLPFVSLLVCAKMEGAGNSEGVPPGTMIFFGADDCPDNWGGTLGAPGRFIIGIGGEPEAEQGGTLGGEPVQSVITSIQHVHKFSGEVELSIGYGGVRRGSGGTHAAFVFDATNYSGTSDQSVQQLPYLVLTACTYTAGQEDWQGAGRSATQ